MKRTPLFDFHIQYGAKMVDFAGWEMPLLYAGIVEEHHHTRQAASVFDVSHMGRIEFHGADVEKLLQRVCTRQLGDAQPGQSRYSHVCNESGGILDDVIVSRYPDHWMMVCNASNRERILNWLHRHAEGLDVRIEDITEATLMIALQGPQVIPLLSQKLPLPVADLKRYRFLTGSYMGITYSVFRSGYTGEDGVEIILPANMAAMIAGYFPGLEPENVKPAGLGARDTLRLEAGMPLYGHELDENTDSLTAGLGWCVDLNKDFIGAEAMRKRVAAGLERKLVGIELEGRRIARHRASVFHGGVPVGEVTSGTFSPTLQKSIAMAYVRADLAEPGTRLEVDVAGKPTGAVVVKLPFYKRN
ncbi:MAG TPA: glycine cleavage system aminomethyltransferase GcvT [Phycisphaerae bacterium]|nr:glycine cleavage system aminomethyltransferase GcvT [Phycisphaerae bacterium]HOB74086.1 glycine cleavage system aminomethyltransferase GcvT [Phycisphaerae bacterium]HOJ56748.1 glycine cleavage system aminomethyltransferase GcvT [Phycisphaerae bacterium]HOL25388.1 glycine cleavage system aminomethyltransferase GcvT [Phycisphaerae bacterium]HPP22064.1 glycine cleavage system aminomethyltransferase GcvT [Phycisphaerae bacterium]